MVHLREIEHKVLKKTPGYVFWMFSLYSCEKNLKIDQCMKNERRKKKSAVFLSNTHLGILCSVPQCCQRRKTHRPLIGRELGDWDHRRVRLLWAGLERILHVDVLMRHVTLIPRPLIGLSPLVFCAAKCRESWSSRGISVKLD